MVRIGRWKAFLLAALTYAAKSSGFIFAGPDLRCLRTFHNLITCPNLTQRDCENNCSCDDTGISCSNVGACDEIEVETICKDTTRGGHCVCGPECTTNDKPKGQCHKLTQGDCVDRCQCDRVGTMSCPDIGACTAYLAKAACEGFKTCSCVNRDMTINGGQREEQAPLLDVDQEL